MDRLSVVLADDDSIMLANMKDIVNWENLGFHVCASVVNGKEALNVIRRQHVDVLITDVMMPVMNGLDLIEHVRNEYPDIKILIISSYNEFSYAKRAIDSGVTTYILKPEINELTFSERLSLLYRQCTAIRKTNTDAILQELQQYFEITDDDSVSFHPALEQLRDVPSYYILASMQNPFCADTSSLLQCWKNDASSLYKKILEFQEFQDSPLAFTYRHYCVIRLPLTSQKQRSEVFLRSLSGKLLFYLNSVSPKECFVCCTNEPVTLSALRDFCRNYSDALSWYATFPDKAVHYFSEIERTFSHAFPVPPFSFSQLSFSRSNIEKDVMTMKTHLVLCNENKSRKALGDFFSRFTLQCKEHIKNDADIPESLCFQTTEYFYKWIFNLYETCILALSSSETSAYSSATVQAINYIEKHFGKTSLSVEEISEAVMLSSGHLGLLFKQDTGMTINEYLTDVRIKKAIYLLKNTGLKIYEITDQCGYKSSQYFSQIFAQKTGKRPIDFRKEK